MYVAHGKVAAPCAKVRDGFNDRLHLMRDGVCEASGHELMLRHEKIQITYTDLSSLQYLGGPSGHQRSLSEEWRACWAFLVNGLGHLWPILRKLVPLSTCHHPSDFPNIVDFYSLEPDSSLTFLRWCFPLPSWPHLLQQQVDSIIGTLSKDTTPWNASNTALN